MKKHLLLISLLATLSINVVANTNTMQTPVTKTSVNMSEKETLKYIDELFLNKKYKIATIELESFLDTYPKSRKTKDVQTRLAKTYFLQKNYEESKRYFQILQVNYKLRKNALEETNLYQVKNYAYLKDFNRANVHLESLTKKENREEGIYFLGLGYYNNQEYNKAQREFSKLLTTKGEWYDQAILYLALSSYNNAQYVKSIVYLDEYYNGDSTDKNYPLMNYIYGSCYFKMEDYETAKKYFSEVVTNYPNDIYADRSNLTLISIYRETKEEQAMYATLAKLEGKQDSIPGYKIVAEYNLGKNDYATANEYFSKIPLASRDANVNYGYAYSLYRSGEESVALKEFTKLRGTELNDEYLYYTTIINYKNKDYRTVLNLRDEIESRELDPKYRDSINEIIANSAYELSEYTTAREYFLKVYEKTYTKENLYKLIIVDSKLNDINDLEIRFKEYRETFVKDQEYRKDVYLAAGLTYQRAGNIERAKGIYKEYLNSNESYEISKNLISILLDEKAYGEMERYLIKQNKSPENSYLRGIAALGLKNFDEAAQYFGATVTGTTDTKLLEKAKYNLVRTYTSSESNEKAIEAATDYLASGYVESKSNVLDDLALSYYRSGDYESSRENYQKLSEDTEYSDYASFQIAETYYAEEEYEDAISGYVSTYTNYPASRYSEAARYWEIKILRDSGRNEEAIQKIDEYMSTDTGNEFRNNILGYRGEIYMNQGNNVAALDSYKIIYETTNSTTEKELAAETLVELNYESGNLEEAKLWASNLTDVNKATYWNGLILEKGGDVNLAHIEYMKLLEVEEYRDKAAYNLATYYEENNDQVEAKRYYEIIESAPESKYKDVAIFKLAAMQEKEGDLIGALRKYTKVSLLYTDSSLREASIIKSATTYEKLDDSDEAMNVYKEYVSEYEDSKYTDYAIEKLIALNLGKDRVIEAKQHYEKLVERAPEKAQKYNEFF